MIDSWLAALRVLIVFSLVGCGNNGTPQNLVKLQAMEENSASVQYLAFQIFTRAADSPFLEKSIPPSQGVEKTVDDIIGKIGMTGGKNRKLGFVPGPISFDDSDERVRQLIRDSFAVARKKNIAVGFHLDDSMFWERLSYLNEA